MFLSNCLVLRDDKHLKVFASETETEIFYLRYWSRKIYNL